MLMHYILKYLDFLNTDLENLYKNFNIILGDLNFEEIRNIYLAKIGLIIKEFKQAEENNKKTPLEDMAKDREDFMLIDF